MVEVPVDLTGVTATVRAGSIFRNPNVPADAFGIAPSGAGQLLQQGGDRLAELALSLQAEDNATEVKEKDNEVSAVLRSITFGDPAAGQPGYYNTRQQNAINAYPEAEKEINDRIAEIIESTSNPVVRRRVEEAAGQRQRATLDRMASHAAAERQNYLDSTGEAREANAAADMAVDWNNFETYDRSLEIIASENEDWQRRNGASDEAAEARLRERQSAAVSGAFENALANDALGVAQRIAARYGDLVDPAMRGRMTKGLKEEGRAARAQALVASARAQYPGDVRAQRDYIAEVSSGKTEDAALRRLQSEIEAERSDVRYEAFLAEQTRAGDVDAVVTAAQERFDDYPSQEAYVRENAEGRVQDQAIRELRAFRNDAMAMASHQDALDAKARDEALRDARSKWSAFVYNRNATTPRTVDNFRDEYPVAFDVLSRRGQIKQIQTEADNVQLGNIFARVSDGVTFAKVQGMGVLERSQYDPEVDRQKLTDTEYRNAVGLVQKANDLIRDMQDKPTIYANARAAINRFVPKDFGTSVTDERRSDEETLIISDATQRLYDWVQEQTAQGKYPNPAEMDRAAQTLMLEVYANPSGPFNSFSGLVTQQRQMTPNQRAVAIVRYEDIPQYMHTQIRAEALRRGIPELSRDLVERIAGATVMRDEDRLRRLYGAARQ